MKPFVIVNPAAGSTATQEALREKLGRLHPKEHYSTRHPGDAEAFACKAIRAGCNYIISAGGDGTLNEIVNAIARSRGKRKVAVGILPLGTGNDFARTLGLPSDIDENIDILRAKKTTPIDLVRVKSKHTRYFVNVSSGGFSGVVDEKLTPDIKRLWGPLAYLRGAAAALPKLRAYRSTIVLDDDKPLSMDLYNLVVANGRFVAGGIPIAPKANPSDGLFDVILIRARPPAEMALLAAQIFLGKHLASDTIIFRRATRVAIKSRPGMSLNTDGEPIGNMPAVFQVVPGALNFVTNKA
ncbi:MAG: diacylglycerol kinase family protein [Verrucomicrobiota bacterium]